MPMQKHQIVSLQIPLRKQAYDVFELNVRLCDLLCTRGVENLNSCWLESTDCTTANKLKQNEVLPLQKRKSKKRPFEYAAYTCARRCVWARLYVHRLPP